MYVQWLRVVDENYGLVSKNAFLIDFKDKSEEKVHVLERFVAKKEDRIKEISAKLERTQKNLKMLNLGRYNWIESCPKVSTLEIGTD